MKATEQFIPVVLFITLYKVVLNFQYMAPWYFHRNKLLSRSRTVTCRLI